MSAAAAFLARHGWQDAARAPIPADASARRYTRLTATDGTRAILMCAPPAEAASLARFRQVAAHLIALGLAAPSEIACDPDHGLLLMEDLGQTDLAALLDRAPEGAEATAAFRAAAEGLRVIAGAPPPAGTPGYSPEAFAAQIDITLARAGIAPARGAEIMAALTTALAHVAPGPAVLALRDCHAENLIWRRAAAGVQRVGWLDFQDAVMLPDGYDLASLLDDVRRDLPETLRAELIDGFARARGEARATAQSRLALLSLIRNLRILGVFDRLITDGGHARYARFLPATRARITRAAQNPALDDLRAPVAEILAATETWGAKA